MNTRYERRSKEAPMEFEWTNKNRDVIPPNSPFSSATKRSHTDMATPNPPFPRPNPATPTFGADRNVPFLFNQPIPSSAPTHHWTPSQQKNADINDIIMRDASPPKPEESNDNSSMRPVATGAMRRVFRARQKHTSPGNPSPQLKRGSNDEYYEETDEEELSEDNRSREMISPRMRRKRGLHSSYSDPVTTTSNYNHHYTFQMPAPILSHSEIPHLLLGYLQFFFNLSLVLGFLYLAFHFFRIVQKDVEHKMVEYAIGSLHEIRACALQYEENFCTTRPSPIIVHKCQEWKECMERDASIVGRTRLFAQLLGEVLDGFMEPITWRTLIFTLTSLSTGIAFVNVLLIFYRGRHAPVKVQTHTQPDPTFPMFGVTSPAANWGQHSSLAPLSVHPIPAGRDIMRAWDSNIEGDSMAETPSRRRRINENEAVSIQ